MSSAQVGKTEIINNIVGYVIDQNPGPMLLLNPTLEMSKTWSKDRLAPMARDTEVLRGKLKDPRSRDSGNTMLHKVFPGGHVTMAGANSPASLASRPIRDVLCDEVDRYPPSAGPEGDPVTLAKKRSTTFWNRKLILTSTPTVKGASRIEMAYESSDRRRFYVPCPHCAETQPLKWSQIHFDKEDPENTTRYVCEHCGAEIEEHEKHRMLALGDWVAEGEFNGTAGFHLNELYSPWRKWSEVVTDFLAAKANPETLKTWINTALGESWEEQGETIDETGLLSRREAYKDCPEGVLILVAAVDVQDDRLELEVIGYGDQEESWGIYRHVIWGDPGKAEIWKELDAQLSRKFDHVNGHKLHIAATCIDSGGHYTKQVYDFCKTRQSRRVFAIKGVGGEGKPVVSAPSPKKYGKSKRPVKLFTVGSDEAKRLVYARLRISEPGPGYCHFPEHYSEEFFSQLTAEKVVTKFHKGFPKKEWVKTRPRNEALDIRAYALAALYILSPVWDALKPKKREEVEDEPPESTARRAPQRVKRGGFVNSWRR